MAPAGQLGRPAGAHAGVRNEKSLHFQQKHPQGHQQAGLLVPLRASAMKIIAFATETPTGAPAVRPGRPAGASVGVRNEKSLHPYRNAHRGTSRTAAAALLVPLWASAMKNRWTRDRNGRRPDAVPKRFHSVFYKRFLNAFFLISRRSGGPKKKIQKNLKTLFF